MGQDVTEAVEYLAGRPDSGLLLIADHASNRLPAGVDLGISAALLDDHIAVDIGAGPLARSLAGRLGCPAILGAWSRLLVDFNREADEPNVIPDSSDGRAIPGNALLTPDERDARIARFWMPYHRFVEARITALRPALLVGVHSFTPQLATRPEHRRPWQVGILYNRDDRAARIAIALLREAGVVTGDNEPYSGQELNATMNRHAEARGLPYLGIEVRQDLIGDEAGTRQWAEHLAPLIVRVAAGLACATSINQ